jgi:hypothetical protein
MRLRIPLSRLGPLVILPIELRMPCSPPSYMCSPSWHHKYDTGVPDVGLTALTLQHDLVKAIRSTHRTSTFRPGDHNRLFTMSSCHNVIAFKCRTMGSEDQDDKISASCCKTSPHVIMMTFPPTSNTVLYVIERRPTFSYTGLVLKTDRRQRGIPHSRSCVCRRQA